MDARGRLRVGAVALLAATTTAGCSRTPEPVDGQDWVVVWQDDFDYPSLGAMAQVWDLSPRYATAHFGEVMLTDNQSVPNDRVARLTTGPFQAFDDGSWDLAQVSTAGPRALEGSEPDYPNARAWMGPLYVEATIRYTENRHAWPAFWMFSLHKIESWEPGGGGDACSDPPQPWELSAEWDIMENGHDANAASSRYFTDIHRNTYDGTLDGWCGVPDSTNKYEQVIPGEVLGDWHRWAGYWRPDGQLCTYMDGRLLRCAPSPDSFLQPMVINFTIARIPTAWCILDFGGCPPLPDELMMEVSSVRVLKPA
jgi:hypothetical protein